MDRACTMHGEIKNAYRILLGKHEQKRPLRKPLVNAMIILKLLLKN
jgi:hypothetical protein